MKGKWFHFPEDLGKFDNENTLAFKSLNCSNGAACNEQVPDFI